MNTFLRTLFISIIVAFPTSAFAAASASIASLYPGNTVGIGTVVTFSMITSGFNGPKYKVVDSFPGGVTTVNMNSGGGFSWTPNKDDLGSHTITVTVTDDNGNSANTSVSIKVITPSVTAGTPTPASTVRFGVPVTFTIDAVGFLSPTYAVTDSFSNSTVTLYHTKDNGTFTWTPTFQDIGVHKLLVTTKDYRNMATTSQTITVIGLPNMSIANLVPGNSVAAGSKLTFEATTTGMVSPLLSVQDNFYVGTTSPFTIDASGRVTWIPSSTDVGVHFITVSATNTAQDRATAQTTITVVPAGTAVTGTTNSAPTNTPTVNTTSKFTFTKDLSVGSRGTEVVALQQKLTELGFFKSEATGYFGAVTKLAVQAFQKSVALPQVGRIGPATRAVLNK